MIQKNWPIWFPGLPLNCNRKVSKIGHPIQVHYLSPKRHFSFSFPTITFTNGFLLLVLTMFMAANDVFPTDLITWFGMIAIGQGTIILAYFLLKIKNLESKEVQMAGILMIILYDIFHDLLVHTHLLKAFTLIWGLGGIFDPLLWVLIFGVLTFSSPNKKYLAHLILPFLYVVFRLLNKLSFETDLNRLNAYYAGEIIDDPWVPWLWTFDISFNLLLPVIYGYLYVNADNRLSSNGSFSWSGILLGIGALFFFNHLFMLIEQLFQISAIWNWGISITFLLLQIGFFGIGLLLMLTRKSTKFADSGLDASASLLCYQELLETMNEQALYTNPQLTLNMVAKTLGRYPRHLSQAISQNSNGNFTDLVNYFRTKKAQKMLADNKTNHLTVEAIGYEVGFNSKATFYRAFKKISGMNPSAYKKKMQTNHIPPPPLPPVEDI